MGTWICHLRVAEALLDQLAGLDPVAFSCGNLAPDSGVPNADWTVFDPPKEVTHFLRPGEGEGRIRDLAFYYQYVVPARHDDSARSSFLLGYFCHLLCDNLWSRRIVAASKQAYAARFEEDANAAWEDLKTDWYDLDHRYVRDHPACLFWRVFYPAPNPPMYLPLVPAAALHQQLDFIRAFYGTPDPAWQLDRPYPYLNQQTMGRFVADCVKDIGSILAQREQLPSLDQEASALAILDQARLCPYDMPLGDR
jgi:hypothetical protein